MRTSWAAAAAPCSLIGPGKRGRLSKRARERLEIERIDKHARIRRHELGRPPDSRGYDRAAARHPLEQRLTERLDQARLAQNVRVREQARNLTVRYAPEQPHRVASLEPRAQWAVARKRERSLPELRECICKSHDVLALVQRADAEKARRTVR